MKRRRSYALVIPITLAAAGAGFLGLCCLLCSLIPAAIGSIS